MTHARTDMDADRNWKTINFGQGKGNLIFDSNLIREVEEQIVQKSRVKLHNGNKYYKTFEEPDLQTLRSLPHMVTFSLNKKPGYLYLFKHRGRPTCLYIRQKDQRHHGGNKGRGGDRGRGGDKGEDPGYNRQEKEWEYVMVKHRFNERLYLGTLFQGEFVQINKFQHLFLINDLLMLKGRAHLAELPEKIKLLQDIFKDKFTADPGLDTHQIMLKEYCDYQQIADFVTNYRLTLPYQNQITGLIFRPHMRNQKNITVVLNRSGFHRNLPDFEQYSRTKKHQERPESGTDGGPVSDSDPAASALSGLVSAQALNKNRTHRHKINHIDHPRVRFRMVQTDKPDVYELWLKDYEKKYGIASIPTLTLSQKVRSWFNNDTDTSQEDTPQEDTPQEDTPQEDAPQEDTPQEDTPQERIVEAEYIKTFNKWQPIKLLDGTDTEVDSIKTLV